MPSRESPFRAFTDSLQTAFQEDDALFVSKQFEESNVRSIRRQIEAIGAGDLPSFLAELNSDVALEIHAPIVFPWIRRAKGIDQVKAAVLHNFSTVEAQAPQVFTVVAQGNLVDITLREYGRLKATQQPYDAIAVQQFVFRNGKVARIREVVAMTTLED